MEHHIVERTEETLVEDGYPASRKVNGTCPDILLLETYLVGLWRRSAVVSEDTIAVEVIV